VLENQGKKGQAVSAYEAAINFAPEFGPAHYALALAYRDAGRSALAAVQMTIFRQAGTRKPTFPDPLMDDVRSMRSTARDLITRAVESAHAGRLDDAIALHLEALASDPSAAQAHVNLISLYGRSGRAELAEQHYRDALRLGNDLADAHYNFGVLMASQGRATDAASAFQRALEADPFHPRAHNNLGALLAREGKTREALEHYRQALASDPQYAAARVALGRVLVELGRPADAVAEFQRLVNLPESAATPGYTFALASVLYASGHAADAIRYAEEAQRAARRYQQEELARTIARELLLMQGGRRD
jgi:Tfp pilus assembly protein PilF